MTIVEHESWHIIGPVLWNVKINIISLGHSPKINYEIIPDEIKAMANIIIPLAAEMRNTNKVTNTEDLLVTLLEESFKTEHALDIYSMVNYLTHRHASVKSAGKIEMINIAYKLATDISSDNTNVQLHKYAVGLLIPFNGMDLTTEQVDEVVSKLKNFRDSGEP